ncbi:MAG: hydroxyacylglutathione hydrolase [Byssovorax sp.]
MRVIPVPCLSDNYAYLAVRDGAKEAIVIDPSEAAPVLAALEQEGLVLVAILNTHHHFDHVGGNEELREKLGPLPVYAHVSDVGRVPAQTVQVEEGKRFSVAGFEVEPMHVPGHTLGAVAYVIEDAVFTGDTLFVAGCGRLFEGTPEQMHTSLSGKLGKLPPETRVFCGHEYTVQNLRFAAFAEPDNQAVADKLDWAMSEREAGRPTVPSTIGAELGHNPFLRCERASLQKHFPGSNATETFAAVRRAKDSFR